MSLLQMSLAGGVMILVITVIRALAMDHVPKRTFPVLWGIALFRLLIPLSLPSALSIYSLLKRTPAPATANIPAAAVSAVLAGQAAALPQSVSVSEAALPVGSIIWAVGTALCAVTFAVAYRNCYREFQMSLPVENDASRRWLQAHPLRRTITLRQTDRISSPLTFGLLHPVILMPKETDWDDEASLQFVLEHEFVHIRRLDTAAKLLLITAVCVHWFNPAVWAMYALANRDIELSCDEAVIRRFGHDARASYARVLIRMEEVQSGLTPLCNHFSKNVIEERITAIMKTKKITVISLLLAAVLVAGTVTVFATSAKEDTANTAHGSISGRNTEAVESGEPLKPSAEYLAAGISLQKDHWYYQKSPIAGIYDDNGGIYTDDSAANGIYLNVRRGSGDKLTELAAITKKQFVELVDRRMNSVETEAEDGSLMSYVNPDDGRTYYSFDDGKTFEPLMDAEFEARFPTPDVEWWTYDEYKAWLDKEKVQLQSLLGESAWTGGSGSFVWTQEKIDETIAMYEDILADIKNGVMYSKSVDGQDQLMMSYNPADIGTSTDTKELYVKLDNGEEHTFGPYETNAEMLAAVKPFCTEQVKLGNMKQSEADEILSRYAAE